MVDRLIGLVEQMNRGVRPMFIIGGTATEIQASQAIALVLFAMALVIYLIAAIVQGESEDCACCTWLGCVAGPRACRVRS
jgi:hypothetical protein